MTYSNDYPLETLGLMQELEQATHEMNLLDEQQKEKIEEQRKAIMKWIRRKPLSLSESNTLKEYLDQYKKSHGAMPQFYVPPNR